MITQKYVTELSYKVVGCAIEVHKYLGAGLLESLYEDCMVDELQTAGLSVQRQVEVPVVYKGQTLGRPLRLDLLVEDLIIVEIKAVEVILPVHKSQLLSYMKLSQKP